MNKYIDGNGDVWEYSRRSELVLEAADEYLRKIEEAAERARRWKEEAAARQMEFSFE